MQIYTPNAKKMDSLDVVIKTLQEDLGEDNFNIYTQNIYKMLKSTQPPLQIRFIYLGRIGFHLLCMAGDRIESLFEGLMALHCNYSINFDYLSEVVQSLSVIATKSSFIKQPIEKINLDGLNWQDGKIRYSKEGPLESSYTFNINGLHTIFNDKKIDYPFEISIGDVKSSFNGVVGYFNADDRPDSRSGFVMQIKCSLGQFGKHSFFVSLEENNPFILMDYGKYISLERFKSYIEKWLYKSLHQSLKASGVGPSSLKELKTFTAEEIKSLITIQSMLKV